MASLIDHRGRPLYDLPHKMASITILSKNSYDLNLKGFFNLFILILVFSNMGVVLENAMSYGCKVKIPTGITDLVQNWPILWCLCQMIVLLTLSYLIERYILIIVVLSTNEEPNKKERKENKLSKIIGVENLLQLFSFLATLISIPLICMNMLMILYLPYKTVKFYNPDPLSSVVLLCFSFVWFFKTLSFHHVCHDARRCILENEDFHEICGTLPEAEIASKYPKCLSIKYYFWYILIPTMCFQFWYPRTSGIKWLEVIKHTIGLLGCLLLMKIIVEQYVVVTAHYTFTLKELQKMNIHQFIVHMTTRIMKLSIPSLYVWLLGFVALFHHYLNILGEITCFADRAFYLDWWNAGSFGEYWRKWNLPVHFFLTRHIFKPIRKAGVNSAAANLLVFTLSALIHEYLVVIPLNIGWTGWVVLAFVLQVPLSLWTQTSAIQSRETLGNVVFWICFCFCGQPIAVLLYYYLWALSKGEIDQIDLHKIEGIPQIPLDNISEYISNLTNV
ncbi:MBOAT family protein [Cryptosporidium muris RN66]|uniref:O-acyltransferase n=1 Tax=Cryptosporidium muris (strain RN66) TaxID=441375 RepID=B6ADZ5_CRYMR|nr:MBOAT family protein [Cryptosporidium muris RN66]EEA06436.1 MBOAT family protein [Cryptosporidium muris RN66]|eukprot:XP_002140785.1 MBOAT family protein [Cryptosporidium muris RN66]